MEQAHVLLLILRGAGLHHRTDDDLKQSASYGIHGNGNQKPCKCVRQHIRKDGKQHKPGSRSDMRQQNGCPVADAVQKPCGEQINSQLDAEIDRNKQRDFCKRDLICPLEHNEQQGNEVVDDCLHNIADIAGQNRLTAGVFHGNTSNSVHYRLYIISVKTLQVPRGLKKFFDLLQKILDKHALQAYISWHDKTVDADE